jgi:subtilisin-like proprotein convertase family protein
MKTFRKAWTLCLGCFAFGSLLALSPDCLAAVTFANTNTITINDPQPFGIAPATPYPSTINVSGFLPSDTLQKVTVTLHNLAHPTPDDIDILLVGPGGQNLIILSDAGGGFADPDVPVAITLDDAAASEVPDDGPLVSGSFLPTNFEPGDAFPSPAPLPSTATNLAVFAGINPNGNWQLYVVDDDALDAGRIWNGWSLTIQTASPAPALTGVYSNNSMVISWPLFAAGYQLQESTNLTLLNSWSPVAQPTVTNANQISVTVPATAPRKFFRLESH